MVKHRDLTWLKHLTTKEFAYGYGGVRSIHKKLVIQWTVSGIVCVGLMIFHQQRRWFNQQKWWYSGDDTLNNGIQWDVFGWVWPSCHYYLSSISIYGESANIFHVGELSQFTQVWVSLQFTATSPDAQDASRMECIYTEETSEVSKVVPIFPHAGS